MCEKTCTLKHTAARKLSCAHVAMVRSSQENLNQELRKLRRTGVQKLNMHTNFAGVC